MNFKDMSVAQLHTLLLGLAQVARHSDDMIHQLLHGSMPPPKLIEVRNEAVLRLKEEFDIHYHEIIIPAAEHLFLGQGTDTIQ